MEGVFDDIQRFIEAHRPCGEVTGRAHPPTSKGYRVWVVCSCGDILDRFVTPEAARHDLIYSNLLALPN
jgi:hypothetical protein